MSSFGGNHGNNPSGDDDEGWGSKFFKAASAAVVAGGLYALLKSSSSTPNSEAQQHSPFESRASRVIKDPDDDDRAWSLHHNDETPPSQNIKWTKPKFGWVKLNVDGSHDHKSDPRSSGCGGVLRDASGKWVLGFAQKLDPRFEIHQAELEAILKGLELAWDMDVEKVVVESDSEPAVSMVENGLGAKYNHKQFDIISRIRELRFDPKWEVKVVHVPREANKVADRLANDARDLLSERLQKYPYPPARCTALVENDAQVYRVSYC